MNRTRRKGGPRARPERARTPSTAARPQQRRALQNLGGTVQSFGDREGARLLERSLSRTEEPTDRLTHGFHAYPARMHPAIARTLIDALTEIGQSVLDPFCGSGTVPVEAMLLGRRAVGVDLNPLALRIAEVHCAVRDRAARERFERTLRGITDASIARVRRREPARAPLSARERAFYAPHVLLELAGLHAEIGKLRTGFDRRALEVVLSAIVVKFSRQRADTAEEQVDKRLRKGLASEFFQRKGEELSQRWVALFAASEAVTVHAPSLRLGDARELRGVLGRRRVQLVVTSPPYGGTYDYHAHHARRYPWLGLRADRLQRDEIGARRRLSRNAQAGARWDAELDACLGALSGALAGGGLAVVLLGDAELAGRRIDAREQIERLSDRAGLRLLAGAAQTRTDYRGGRDRREHLLLLERMATATGRSTSS